MTTLEGEVNDTQHAVSSSNGFARNSWMHTLRNRINRLGTDVFRASKRNSRSNSNAYNRRRQKVTPDRLQASIMIHLGIAWRAQAEGEPLKAILHLRRAVEDIMLLIERWTSTVIEGKEDGLQ